MQIVEWIAKLRNSIFAKLLLILILTWAAINVLAGVTYKSIFTNESDVRYKTHLLRYADYLIDEIGMPVDTLKARALSEELAIEIGILSDSLTWSSADVDPASFYSQLQHRRWRAFGWRHGRIFLTRQRDKTRFVFHSNVMRHVNLREWVIPIFIVLLAFILAASWFSMRRILKPINWLSSGAEQIGQGNLDHRIPLRSKDELAQLSLSFNKMAGRIRQMIHLRDQLLLDVSHELRSPITRMTVALALLPDSARKEGIADDLAEMETMISEILEAERLDSDHGGLERTDIDLQQVVETVAETYRDIKPGIKFTSATESTLVSADEARLRTVFKNLLENALKYSDSDGPDIQVSISKTGDMVKVKIRDFGIGIAAEDLPHIFEPFYRVDKSRSRETGGYGLGMSICAKIIAAHDGKIDVESEIGKGTTVAVQLPAAN